MKIYAESNKPKRLSDLISNYNKFVSDYFKAKRAADRKDPNKDVLKNLKESLNSKFKSEFDLLDGVNIKIFPIEKVWHSNMSTEYPYLLHITYFKYRGEFSWSLDVYINNDDEVELTPELHCRGITRSVYNVCEVSFRLFQKFENFDWKSTLIQLSENSKTSSLLSPHEFCRKLHTMSLEILNAADGKDAWFRFVDSPFRYIAEHLKEIQETRPDSACTRRIISRDGKIYPAWSDNASSNKLHELSTVNYIILLYPISPYTAEEFSECVSR